MAVPLSPTVDVLDCLAGPLAANGRRRSVSSTAALLLYLKAVAQWISFLGCTPRCVKQGEKIFRGNR
jgi:hypothetical protein